MWQFSFQLQMCLLNSVCNVHIERRWTGHRCRIIAIFNVFSIRNDNKISNIPYEVINTQYKRNVQSDWISNCDGSIGAGLLEAGPGFSYSWIVITIYMTPWPTTVHPAVSAQWTWSPWFPFEVPVQGWMLPFENTGHGRWKQPINMQPPRVTAGVVSGVNTEQLVLLLVCGFPFSRIYEYDRIMKIYL